MEAPAGLSAHRPEAGLRKLFAPLDDLLVGGGDPRLALDHGCNGFGCSPPPASQLLCFSSSTASPISERGYARTERAREQLMHAAIGLGLDEALEPLLGERLTTFVAASDQTGSGTLATARAAPTAVLRLCVGARQVTETWNAGAAVARDNLDREIGRLTEVVAKTELLVSHVSSLDLGKV